MGPKAAAQHKGLRPQWCPLLAQGLLLHPPTLELPSLPHKKVCTGGALCPGLGGGGNMHCL